jgi:hypothetical protein
MTKIWSYSEGEILDVKGLYYHCKSEEYYRSNVLEHRRKPLKKYRRVSRVKRVKPFLEGVNRMNEEWDNELMTSEVARAFGWCYNCGGQCPMNYKVDEEVA